MIRFIEWIDYEVELYHSTKAFILEGCYLLESRYKYNQLSISIEKVDRMCCDSEVLPLNTTSIL